MFRTLTAGIRFDKDKYRQEAEKFGLVKKQTENVQEEVAKAISLENDLIPDSNLPTPDESDEDNNELQLLGNKLDEAEMLFVPIHFFFLQVQLKCGKRKPKDKERLKTI